MAAGIQDQETHHKDGYRAERDTEPVPLHWDDLGVSGR
jgi:hypothetical protein